MKIRNLFFSLLAAFTIIFSVASCAMIGDEIGENKSSFFTLAIRSSGSRSARSSSTNYTPVDIVTNFTESQFRETVTRFVIKINNEPEIIASLGSAVESREEYPIGSQVTVSYTAYGNIDFTGSSQTTMTNTRKEVIIASETKIVTVEAGGTNVQFNVKQGLKDAAPYTVNTYEIIYNGNTPSSSGAGPVSVTNMPNNQTGIEENTVTQISSQIPSIIVSQMNSQTSSITNSSSSTTYTFSHWLGDDGNIYQPGQNVTMTKDLNLSAQWTPAGGGSSEGDSSGGNPSGGDSETPALPPPTEAQEFDTIYVGSSGNPSNGRFTTIGEAFDAIRDYKTKTTITIQIEDDYNYTRIDSNNELDAHGKTVTIRGSSADISILRAPELLDEPLFSVRQGTLQFSNITISGNGEEAQAPLILVEGGELHIQTGTTLQNNNNTDFYNGGGAIRMTDGSLTIDNDTSISITDNNSNYYGGGIYVTGGTVTIPNESVISGNTATSEGAQIYIFNGVTYNGSPLDAEKKIE